MAKIIVMKTQKGISVNLTDGRSIWGTRQFRKYGKAQQYISELAADSRNELLDHPFVQEVNKLAELGL